MFSFLRLSIFLLVLALAPAMASATPMHAGAAPAHPKFLPIAAEIGQQLQGLVTGDPTIEIEPQETFGTRALSLVLNTFKLVAKEGSALVDNFAALPELGTWVELQYENKYTLDRWNKSGSALFFVLAGSLLAGWLADFLFVSFRRRLNKKAYPNMSHRLVGIFSWFFLSLIPVAVFIGSALAIMAQIDPGKLPRIIVMMVIYSLAILRLIRVATRFFLSPRVPSLRLLPISDAQAHYAQKWIKAFSTLMVMGFMVTEIGGIMNMPDAALSGFKNLIALAVICMTIAVIMQKRSSVSTFIRGNLSAARARQSLVDNLRLWLARSWHVLAISYLVIGYLVTTIGADGGFMLMQTGTIGTLLSLFFLRFLLYMAGKFYHAHKGRAQGNLYNHVFAFLLRVAAWVLAASGIAASWGADIPALMSSAWGQRIIGSGVSIMTATLLIVLAYEFIHGFVESRLNRVDHDGNPIEASARAKTLLPMAKYASMIILGLVGGFVILSELGINTAPLLAGAGVLGLAVGFGSQTLVKDFLTGLFIILEETISIGDVVQVGDHTGSVESMTIRTVRLRDLHGKLHILPFSEITTITNSSKGFSQALIEVGVSYSADLTRVMDVMKEVGLAMANESEFKNLMLDPIEVLGVQDLADSSVIIRARIKTVTNEQWHVRRAYLLRLKLRFDKDGIEIPFPQRVVYHRYAGVNEGERAEIEAVNGGGE